MKAALYYHPEAYSMDGPKLMGRHAAGASFLRGFLAHAQADIFWIQVQQAEHARHFMAQAKARGRGEPVRAIGPGNLAALSEPGLVFYPGPGIGDHAWPRSFFGHGRWSLCGITHTTASAGVMDAVTALLNTPVQAWDAVICTSQVVRSNLDCLLQAQMEYLRERTGASRFALPQLPVIPLGIHTQDFVFSAEQRHQARMALGAQQDTLVVLFMGRLSFHAKANPLAMYQALQQAARTSGKPVLLVECGWHANAAITQAYAQAAAAACPDVRVLTLDGRQAANRQTAWAGADVFCSLSDNLQETFGITPIEAMAAGLPAVVSDWDGYKDTVRDSVDGFRVPTWMPSPGWGPDLALRHALEVDTYDQYCGYTSSLVAVDIQAATQAFLRLFESPDLRQRMGQAGRERAQTVYDWKTVLAQYQDLWAHLHAIRQAESPALKPLAQPWPARMDPFTAFAAYPTQPLRPDTRLALVDPDAASATLRLRQLANLAMVNFAQPVLPTESECLTLLSTLNTECKTAWGLAQTVPPSRRALVLRALAWLLKLGVLRVLPQP